MVKWKRMKWGLRRRKGFHFLAEQEVYLSMTNLDEMKEIAAKIYDSDNKLKIAKANKNKHDK